MKIRHIVSVLLATIGGVSFADEAAFASLKAYPQKDLYAHWDAIQNVTQDGEAVHSSETNVWKDLVGSHDLMYTGSGLPSWTGNAYVSTKSVLGYMSCATDADFLRNMGDSWTIQAYITPDDYAEPGDGWPSGHSSICGYHSWNDMSINGIYFGEFVSPNFGFVIYRARAEHTKMLTPWATFYPYYHFGRRLLLTMTATPVSCKLYLNDTLLMETPTSEAGDTLLTAPAFFVGNCYDVGGTDSNFSGQIHSVRLYKRALTAEEVNRSFAVDSNRFSPTGTRDLEFLDYVESNGSQAFDTGLAIHPGYEAEGDFTPPADTALLKLHSVFGNQFSGSGFLLNFTEGNIRFHSGGVWKDLAPAPGVWQPGERFHFRGSNRGYEVNGTWIDFGTEPTGDQTYNLNLFKVGSFGGTFKLHRFSLRDANGSLLRNYYPARQISTGTIGLYDTVDEQFFAPSAGTLAAGPNLTDMQISVTLKGVDRSSASFTILPLVRGENDTDVVAYYTHDGKTESKKISSFSAQATGTLTGVLDALKPDTDYQVYFTVGDTRFPAGSETIAFRTLPEVLSCSAYTALEYFQSTGNESFNTHVIVSPSIAMAVDFTPHDSTAFQNNILFGSAISQAGFLMQFYLGNVRFHTGNCWADIAPGESTWQAGQRMTLLGTRSGFFVNDVWTPLTPYAGDATAPIAILTGEQLNSARSRGIVQLHGCVISNCLGGVLRDYVPVRRNADGLLGLFDRVNGTFVRSEDLYTGWGVAGAAVDVAWLKASLVKYTGRALDATLTRSAGGAADIYAVWGDAYGADDLTAWVSSAKVGTFADGATSAAVTVKPLTATAKYVRFYTTDGRWSESFTLADVKLTQGLIIFCK